MRHSRGRASTTTEFISGVLKVAWFLGVGTQEDLDSLEPGNPRYKSIFDVMNKVGAVLNVVLRDGPLSNFCILGRLAFDKMVSDVSDLTSDDTKKLWKTLERMVDTPAAPFANSSGAAWARFDHLCTLVRDPAFLGGNSQSVERLRPLLEMIEEVERIRPPADRRAEGTGNVVRGGPEETFFFPSIPGTIPLAEIPRVSASRSDRTQSIRAGPRPSHD